VTVQACDRCGQLLLPEIVRELGDGRRCPFCGADLKVDARPISGARPPAARAPSAVPPPIAPAARAQVQAPIPPQPPARRPLPAAPIARAAASPAAPSLLGMSAARTQSTSAAAVALAPRAPEPQAAPTPALALARTPEPDTAPNPLPVAAPLFTLAPSSPAWLAALRRRPWLAAPVVLAVIVTIALVAGRRPSATKQEPSLPAASAAPQPAAAAPSATPLAPAPPAQVAPDHPVAAEDTAPSTTGSHAATGHVKAGKHAHATKRTHRHQKRAARPSRGKHARVVALEKTAAAPKGAGDERSARDAYERGNQRLLSGDAAGAVAAYQEAVRAAPASPSGYRGLGLAYEKEGKTAEAVGAFRHYLKLAPSSGDRELVARRVRHLLRHDGDPGK
jgi:hypothetical protein